VVIALLVGSAFSWSSTRRSWASHGPRWWSTADRMVGPSVDVGILRCS